LGSASVDWNNDLMVLLSIDYHETKEKSLLNLTPAYLLL
jgi:hypothetical protein